LSLYGGGTDGEPVYGIMFQGTPTFGTHGSVTGSWATYFTMNADDTRGWIFRKAGTGNVASISAGGNLSLNGSLQTISGNITSGGGNVYVGNGSSTNGRIEYRHTNGSHVQMDVRPLDTHWCYLHKFTLSPTQSYGAYAENWWDGDSYHSIRIIGGVFNFGGGILATGDITAFSDRRLKENIETLNGKKVLQMRGVSFTKDGEKGSGVIAQEIEEVAPELVKENIDGIKSVAYGNLVGYLIEGLKEQQKEIDELKALVKQLLEK